VSPQRLHAMVLIAPAADFTEALMKPGLPPEAHEAIARDGEWIRPSLYEPTGYPITRGLLEDGARWTILGAPVPIEITATDFGRVGWIIILVSGAVVVGGTALRIRAVQRERAAKENDEPSQ